MAIHPNKKSKKKRTQKYKRKLAAHSNILDMIKASHDADKEWLNRYTLIGND